MLYAFNYDNSLSSFTQFQSGEIINELETIALDILEMILADRPFHLSTIHPTKGDRASHTLAKIVIITRN